MKKLSLAARYRPQSFAEVAGQDMVKAVLSRAAAEDKVAAAYLLSGTRGVGKTTIARIFAKALNCEHAPAPEPCNQCAQCRKITQGTHVDVAEIDGASNNSVEDARALRETIGYAPMEGRYKVFIIDEAHMLSRNAFNALLKTLEEPPANVVFIFATTEVHKFPITIVSRCQHFVFRHLDEQALIQHLSSVLQKEQIPFEESAVRILARRAAGSVRDSMSLLDQTLALGGEQLTAEMTRNVLGLAGQELFERLFQALLDRDCPSVAGLCTELLQRGVDIGYFIRELSGHLRTLFLLSQGGEAMLPHLGLSPEELRPWKELAPRFSPAHIHAAWQMTLDAQSGIVHNPEPAAALELLLLNVALLPRLLPVDKLPGAARSLNSPAPQMQTPQMQVPSRPADASVDRSRAAVSVASPSAACPQPRYNRDHVPAAAEQKESEQRSSEEEPDPSPAQAVQPARHDWKAFCEFCAAEQEAGRPAPTLRLLKMVTAEWSENELRLRPQGETVLHQVEKERAIFMATLAAFGAGNVTLHLEAPRPSLTEAELVELFSRKPELQDCLEVFRGKVDACFPEK